ncbi:sodium:proton antiporter [Kaistia algarum]|nr:sodium:proton antiporter [Kaistia algarum]
MIVVAVWMISVKNAFAAIIDFMVFGLLLALAWLRIEAPDVGLTEIAIGSGATGVILLRARGLARDRDEMSATPSIGFKILVGALCGGVTLGLAALVLMPPDPAPTLAYAAAENLHLTGVGNPITAVLMAYRAFDTFLETVVVLLALLGVWSLTPDRFWGGRPGPAPAASVPAPLTFLAQWLVPLGVLIGIYIFWIGADEPGGKFQGATILAAMWVLLMMAGLTDAPPVTSRRLRAALLVGPAVFMAVGIAGFWLAGDFLAYPPDFAKPVIIVIEAAMLISVAAALGMLLAGPPMRESEP